MPPHVQNRSFRDLTKGSIPYGPFVGTLLWETPRTPQRAGLMVVGLPNVARSPHDLESGVGTHVCRPFVPSTPKQKFLGDCEESWGIRESTRVVQQTMATDIPACEAHTAVYTFGPDIVCWLTPNANGCLMTMYLPVRAGYTSHLAVLHRRLIRSNDENTSVPSNANDGISTSRS